MKFGINLVIRITRRNFGLRVSAAKRIFDSFHTVEGFNKISKHSKSHAPPHSVSISNPFLQRMRECPPSVAPACV